MTPTEALSQGRVLTTVDDVARRLHEGNERTDYGCAHYHDSWACYAEARRLLGVE